MSFNPNAEQQGFIRRWSQALTNNDAAVFAGAGFSRPAGYVDWKSLLKEIASELKLDVEREDDLIAVAQYHLNEKRNRNRINQTIIDEFTGSATPARSHSLLARLPLQTVWTTNYDQLLENSFINTGKIVDLKITQEDLAHTKRGRDVVIYKMHGCVTRPEKAVVTKDDYEQYEKKLPLFVESLKGDLISKTFLFLGFSFLDPNIDYILSRVRILLGANVREHFCVMRRVQRPSRMVGKKKTDYEYELRKSVLREADLRRFGIETIWIDDFSQVTSLLDAVSSFIHRKSVFVSGAASDSGPLSVDRLQSLSKEIGKRLMLDGFNLVSGFGLGIGEQCVLGALGALYGIPKGTDLDRLIVRPFPKAAPAKQQAENTRHREELISRSGVVIVICGNRATSGGAFEISPGVMEEVEIARREGKFIIPIGATGHAAKKLWEEAISNSGKYLPNIAIESELTTLGDESATNEQLLNALFQLLTKTEKAVTV